MSALRTDRQFTRPFCLLDWRHHRAICVCSTVWLSRRQVLLTVLASIDDGSLYQWPHAEAIRVDYAIDEEHAGLDGDEDESADDDTHQFPKGT